MAGPVLEQDPHRVRDERENILEVAIGREVRTYRTLAGMTVAELSRRTGLSIGMLSKIENGNTSPSLTTLQSLSHALNVPVTAFFRRFEDVHNAVHTKAGEGVETERRGTRAGHQYNLLGHLGQNASGVVVEPYLITLTSDSDVFPPPLEARVRGADVALIDGTFYDREELPHREILEIKHPFVVESVARFADASTEIHFIHLNHTNPALDPNSEASKAIEAAGLKVAVEGDRYPL